MSYLVSEARAGRQHIQLAYGDCDTLGIAYFAVYYPWMERCYSTWLGAHGLRSGELADELGVFVVGVRSEVDYLATASVLDVLVCQAVLDRIGPSSYTLGFDFTRDSVPIARGRMTFAVRDLEMGRTTIPERLRDLLGALPQLTR